MGITPGSNYLKGIVLLLLLRGLLSDNSYDAQIKRSKRNLDDEDNESIGDALYEKHTVDKREEILLPNSDDKEKFESKPANPLLSNNNARKSSVSKRTNSDVVHHAEKSAHHHHHHNEEDKLTSAENDLTAGEASSVHEDPRLLQGMDSNVDHPLGNPDITKQYDASTDTEHGEMMGINDDLPKDINKRSNFHTQSHTVDPPFRSKTQTVQQLTIIKRDVIDSDKQKRSTDKESEQDGGAPSHFQVDDKSADLEINANSAGVKVKAKPASLQVVSRPGSAHAMPPMLPLPQAYYPPPPVETYHYHHPHHHHIRRHHRRHHHHPHEAYVPDNGLFYHTNDYSWNMPHPELSRFQSSHFNENGYDRDLQPSHDVDRHWVQRHGFGRSTVEGALDPRLNSALSVNGFNPGIALPDSDNLMADSMRKQFLNEREVLDQERLQRLQESTMREFADSQAERNRESEMEERRFHTGKWSLPDSQSLDRVPYNDDLRAFHSISNEYHDTLHDPLFQDRFYNHMKVPNRDHSSEMEALEQEPKGNYDRFADKGRSLYDDGFEPSLSDIATHRHSPLEFFGKKKHFGDEMVTSETHRPDMFRQAGLKRRTFKQGKFRSSSSSAKARFEIPYNEESHHDESNENMLSNQMAPNNENPNGEPPMLQNPDEMNEQNSMFSGATSMPEVHGDYGAQTSEQEEALKEDKEFAKVTEMQEEMYKKLNDVLPLGDVPRPDLYPVESKKPDMKSNMHSKVSEERGEFHGGFKKDNLPSYNKTESLSSNETAVGNASSNENSTETSKANESAQVQPKTHGLSIEVSKSKSLNFADAGKNQTPKITKKSQVLHFRDVRRSIRRSKKHLKRKHNIVTEGKKKNDIVINRPPVIYHPPPEIYHRPAIVLHRPPIMIQRPSIIYHQPPVVVHRPAVIYRQPPLIFHQPPPIVHQPFLNSNDKWVPVASLKHVGSSLTSAGVWRGTPPTLGQNSLANMEDSRIEPGIASPLSGGLGNQISGGMMGNQLSGGLGNQPTGGLGNQLTDGLGNQLSGGLGNQLSGGLGNQPTGGLGNQLSNGPFGTVTNDISGPNELSGTLDSSSSDQVPALTVDPEPNTIGARKSVIHSKKKHKKKKKQRERRDTGHSKTGTKKDVVVNRPPIIYHPPPEIYHRPDIVIHRPPIVIHRPPIIYHQPPVIVHRPAVVYHQPPIVFHQPPPAVQQPLLYSHDTFVVHPSYIAQHLGSVLRTAHHYIGPPRLLTQLGSPLFQGLANKMEESRNESPNVFSGTTQQEEFGGSFNTQQSPSQEATVRNEEAQYMQGMQGAGENYQLNQLHNSGLENALNNAEQDQVQPLMGNSMENNPSIQPLPEQYNGMQEGGAGPMNPAQMVYKRSLIHKKLRHHHNHKTNNLTMTGSKRQYYSSGEPIHRDHGEAIHTDTPMVTNEVFPHDKKNVEYHRLDNGGHDIVVHRPGVIFHPPPEVIHRPNLVIHRAPLLIHRAPIVVHQAPVIIHRAPVLYHQPDVVFHSPPPVIQQQQLNQHDMLASTPSPSLHYAGSEVHPVGSLDGTPTHTTYHDGHGYLGSNELEHSIQGITNDLVRGFTENDNTNNELMHSFQEQQGQEEHDEGYIHPNNYVVGDDVESEYPSGGEEVHDSSLVNTGPYYANEYARSNDQSELNPNYHSKPEIDEGQARSQVPPKHKLNKLHIKTRRSLSDDEYNGDAYTHYLPNSDINAPRNLLNYLRPQQNDGVTDRSLVHYLNGAVSPPVGKETSVDEDKKEDFKERNAKKQLVAPGCSACGYHCEPRCGMENLDLNEYGNNENFNGEGIGPEGHYPPNNMGYNGPSEFPNHGNGFAPSMSGIHGIGYPSSYGMHNGPVGEPFPPYSNHHHSVQTVYRRPDIVVPQPPDVIHRPDVIIHRKPVIIHRNPVIYHQQPVMVHKAPVIVHQAPIIVHPVIHHHRILTHHVHDYQEGPHHPACECDNEIEGEEDETENNCMCVPHVTHHQYRHEHYKKKHHISDIAHQRSSVPPIDSSMKRCFDCGNNCDPDCHPSNNDEYNNGGFINSGYTNGGVMGNSHGGYDNPGYYGHGNFDGGGGESGGSGVGGGGFEGGHGYGGGYWGGHDGYSNSGGEMSQGFGGYNNGYGHGDFEQSQFNGYRPNNGFDRGHHDGYHHDRDTTVYKRPDIVVPQPPDVIHRPDIVIHRAPIIVHRRPIVYHQAPVIVHKPPVVVHQAPIVVHPVVHHHRILTHHVHDYHVESRIQENPPCGCDGKKNCICSQRGIAKTKIEKTLRSSIPKSSKKTLSTSNSTLGKSTEDFSTGKKKKKDVVVSRPPIIYHPPPEIYHRPDIVVHRPPLLIHRPSIIYHQPPVIVHRPAVVYHQPPLVFHQPPPAVQQPLLVSHDTFRFHPSAFYTHMGSVVNKVGSYVGVPHGPIINYPHSPYYGTTGYGPAPPTGYHGFGNSHVPYADPDSGEGHEPIMSVPNHGGDEGYDRPPGNIHEDGLDHVVPDFQHGPPENGPIGDYGHPGGDFGHPGGEFGHPGGEFGHPGGEFGHPDGDLSRGDYGHVGGEYGHTDYGHSPNDFGSSLGPGQLEGHAEQPTFASLNNPGMSGQPETHEGYGPQGFERSFNEASPAEQQVPSGMGAMANSPDNSPVGHISNGYENQQGAYKRTNIAKAENDDSDEDDDSDDDDEGEREKREIRSYHHHEVPTKRHRVVVGRPDIIYHQAPEIVHRPPLVVHRPDIVIHRPSVIVHRPAVVVHRPAVMYHQPPVIFNTPPPVIHQPSAISHDMYVTHNLPQRIGSRLQPVGGNLGQVPTIGHVENFGQSVTYPHEENERGAGVISNVESDEEHDLGIQGPSAYNNGLPAEGWGTGPNAGAPQEVPVSNAESMGNDVQGVVGNPYGAGVFSPSQAGFDGNGYTQEVAPSNSYAHNTGFPQGEQLIQNGVLGQGEGFPGQPIAHDDGGYDFANAAPKANFRGISNEQPWAKSKVPHSLNHLQRRHYKRKRSRHTAGMKKQNVGVSGQIGMSGQGLGFSFARHAVDDNHGGYNHGCEGEGCHDESGYGHDYSGEHEGYGGYHSDVGHGGYDGSHHTAAGTHATVLYRPDVVFHPRPELYHRPDIIVHRPDVVIHRPSVVIHQPPVLVHRPSVIVHQPPIVFHQPPPVVHRPQMVSHDHYVAHATHEHVGSELEHTGHVTAPAGFYEGHPTGHTEGYAGNGHYSSEEAVAGYGNGAGNDNHEYVGDNHHHDDTGLGHSGIVSNNGLYSGHGVSMENHGFDGDHSYAGGDVGSVDHGYGSNEGAHIKDYHSEDLVGDEEGGQKLSGKSEVMKVKERQHNKKHSKKVRRDAENKDDDDVEDENDNEENEKKSKAEHETASKKHQVTVIHRPDVIFHQRPEVIHRPDIVVHRPDVVINRPDVIIHRPAVIVHKPPMVIHQPPIVFHQSHPIMHTPLQHSHDMYVQHSVPIHVGSHVEHAGNEISPGNFGDFRGQEFDNRGQFDMGMHNGGHEMGMANNLGGIDIPNMAMGGHDMVGGHAMMSGGHDVGMGGHDIGEGGFGVGSGSGNCDNFNYNNCHNFGGEPVGHEHLIGPIGFAPQVPDTEDDDSRSNIPKKRKHVKGSKKHHVTVIHRPDIVYHPKPEIVHRPDVIVHRPDVVIHRPSVVVHRPPVVIHKPPVVIHQSPIVFHQPNPIINQPVHQSNDLFALKQVPVHVGSHLVNSGATFSTGGDTNDNVVGQNSALPGQSYGTSPFSNNNAAFQSTDVTAPGNHDYRLPQDHGGFGNSDMTVEETHDEVPTTMSDSAGNNIGRIEASTVNLDQGCIGQDGQSNCFSNNNEQGQGPLTNIGHRFASTTTSLGNTVGVGGDPHGGGGDLTCGEYQDMPHCNAAYKKNAVSKSKKAKKKSKIKNITGSKRDYGGECHGSHCGAEIADNHGEEHFGHHGFGELVAHHFGHHDGVSGHEGRHGFDNDWNNHDWGHGHGNSWEHHADHQHHHADEQNIVVQRPDIVFHPRPELYHRPDIIVHRPDIVIHRPSVVIHQPPVLVHRPAVIYHQPPVVFHQPGPVVHRPRVVSHDMYVTHDANEQVGSQIEHADGGTVGPGGYYESHDLHGGGGSGTVSGGEGGGGGEGSYGSGGGGYGGGGYGGGHEEEHHGDEGGGYGGYGGGHHMGSHGGVGGHGFGGHGIGGFGHGFGGHGFGGHDHEDEGHGYKRALIHNRHRHKHHIESPVKKHKVVVFRPPIIYHPPPEIYHRADLIVHRPDVVISRPSVVVHRPDVVVHRPNIVYHQPPVVFFTPPPAIHQPVLQSHDSYVTHPVYQHVSSNVQHVGGVIAHEHALQNQEPIADSLNVNNLVSNERDGLNGINFMNVGSPEQGTMVDNTAHGQEMLHPEEEEGEELEHVQESSRDDGLPVNGAVDSAPAETVQEGEVSDTTTDVMREGDGNLGVVNHGVALPTATGNAIDEQPQPESTVMGLGKSKVTNNKQHHVKKSKSRQRRSVLTSFVGKRNKLSKKPNKNKKRSKLQKQEKSKDEEKKKGRSTKKTHIEDESDNKKKGKASKKNDIVVKRPPVIYHPPPEIYHRPPIIVHRPPLVIRRPPIIYHQPPVIVHRPAVVYHQPPLIFHQPPPAVSQPILKSHDTFMMHPAARLTHMGSMVTNAGTYVGVPEHRFMYQGGMGFFHAPDQTHSGYGGAEGDHGEAPTYGSAGHPDATDQNPGAPITAPGGLESPELGNHPPEGYDNLDQQRQQIDPNQYLGAQSRDQMMGEQGSMFQEGGLPQQAPEAEEQLMGENAPNAMGTTDAGLQGNQHVPDNEEAYSRNFVPDYSESQQLPGRESAEEDEDEDSDDFEDMEREKISSQSMKASKRKSITKPLHKIVKQARNKYNNDEDDEYEERRKKRQAPLYNPYQLRQDVPLYPSMNYYQPQRKHHRTSVNIDVIGKRSAKDTSTKTSETNEKHFLF